MSSVGITTDFIARRDQFNAELRALENDVKQTATRLKGSPLKLNIDFDATQAAQAFRTMLANLQTTARNAPIIVPVVFQPQGGMPGMPGGAGGGVSNVTNVINQYATGAGAAPDAAGGGRGGMGRMGLFRGLIALRAGYDTAVAGGYAATVLGRDAFNGVTGRGYSTGDLQAREDLITSGQESIRKLPLLGDVISGTGSGINRFYSAQMNLGRSLFSSDRRGGERGFESDVGYAERMKEVIKLEDEHTDKLSQQARQHRAIGERLEHQVTVLNRRAALMSGPAMSGQQRAGFDAAAAITDLNAELQRPEFRDAKGRLTGNAAEYRTARLREIEAQRRFNIASAIREEDELTGRTNLQVGGIAASANEAVMRASGRGTEANFEARQRARGERLARAQIALNAETDPVRKAQLQRVLVAEQLAAPQEAAADRLGLMRGTTQDMRSANIATTAANLVTAGRPREASLYSRNAAIDERLRQQREEANNTRDPFVRGQLQTRLRADTAAGEAEKRANIAEDWRRTLDAIEQNTIAKDQARLQIARSDAQAELQIFDKQTERRLRKIESAEEKKSFTEARAEERRALQAEQTQRHFSFRAQTLDIMLRTRGQGGLADELGIEDEFRQNRLAAGNDPRAKQDALDRYRARLNQFVRGSWSPQMFNSFAQFDEAAQMSIINRDAMGLQRARRALAGVAGLQGKDLGALNPENAGGFGPEDVEKFNTATGKLDKAADKLGQNTLVAVKF
jgi:hypothetical protein